MQISISVILKSDLAGMSIQLYENVTRKTYLLGS